ncbi:DndE family protein [Parabacteroides sp. AD58]|uniref:DndE family protein n=1 Tax=Parabacteroides absconsus TaxID=2951805 RepID=A0ABZ2ISX4_9BACT|nr:DndE family protein [Parabacteroides sp. AD58]MCM6903348.1 DndE family protein [Parabacteroides sp. AD58]
MFTQIKTSKKNKEVVTLLSRNFNLGAENIVARIALAYSLSSGKKMNLSDIQDSQGKEYSKSVLFGNFINFYIGLICVHYNLYKTDKDIPKYIKMHIDDGLEMMNKEMKENPNLNGMDYLIDKIEKGLESFLELTNGE